ncbi:MAG TPA: hypothetical protein VGQ50_11770 [Actinomycetota bacterium]|jgi:hypothetical protein|nr:hypothetical protein [Actinomycetota bacterium]
MILSPVSARPAVPAFVVWMSVAVGAVLSTVTLYEEAVPVLPTASTAHTVYDFVPAASGLLAVSALLRQPYVTPPMR